METEQALPISAVSVVEEVLQQHGSRLRDFDFASRKAEEAGLSFLKMEFDFFCLEFDNL